MESAELSVTNPQTIMGENHADLFITPNVPGSEKADVTFYKAVNITDLQGYSNVIDSTVLQNKNYSGKLPSEKKLGVMLQRLRKQACHIRPMM